MTRSGWIAAVVVALVSASAAWAADSIDGPARVIDGDTIVVGTVKVRLDGIDAPETDQVCLDSAGNRWTCGIAARDALAARIGNGNVSCTSRGEDRYGRTLAYCSTGDEELNGWMARQGFALAYVQYSRRYVPYEAIARDKRRGLWAGAFAARAGGVVDDGRIRKAPTFRPGQGQA